jgi:hypothetical protein
MDRVPVTIFALLVLCMGGICVMRPVAVVSFFERYVGERESFARKHPQVTIASIRFSGFCAILMGVFLLYAAFAAR